MFCLMRKVFITLNVYIKKYKKNEILSLLKIVAFLHWLMLKVKAVWPFETSVVIGHEYGVTPKKT